jgi:asparagine synthase (glutamine-hydrolysing)
LSWTRDPAAGSVQKMSEHLRHRGPDDVGLVEMEHLALGHRRLSIIDLSPNAKQPMTSADGRFVLVYNGEVYNFIELRQELRRLGVNFRSSSDTEVVLYAYIFWGSQCLKRFNGMFALAIWDSREKELFLARDRFGKKPLYYYHHRDGVTFASELTALLADEEIPRRVSLEAINCYLSLGYILAPMTIYQDIYKLESATCLTISQAHRTPSKARYWNYADYFRVKSAEKEETIADNILTLLEQATERRLISDVPVGAFLSGGLDSSSVVSLMKRHHPETLHTFSVGFEEETYNELPDADRAAAWINTSHHSLMCRGGKDGRLIDEAIAAYDEPFADNSLIPMVAVSRLAANYVKVVLSGDGADEIFAGYLTYKADKYYSYARYLPDFVKRFMTSMGESQQKAHGKLNWAYKQKQFFYGTLHDPDEAHYLWRLIFNPEERLGILGSQYRDLVYDSDPFHIFQRYYQEVKDLKGLDRHLYVDAMTWLPDDILVKVDRATMASSIEARCPFLDVELVEYAASVPANLKLKGLRPKYILKRALQNVLPQFILDKAKSGFNAPTGAWLGRVGVDEFKAFNQYVFLKKVPEWLN